MAENIKDCNDLNKTLEILSQPLYNPSNTWNEYFCVEKLEKEAFYPTKGSAGSAGYDLYAYGTYTVPAWGRCLVKTGLRFGFRPNLYARVAPRSGLSLKHGIEVGAGVIDSDYRGEVGVVLYNFSDNPFLVNNGDRIAQVILECHANVPMKKVSSVTDLFGNDRGGGFGSTGV
jgi:dUTP pyrophosphatase